MSNDTQPACSRCGQPVQFAGRVGLPPMIIYRCNGCDIEQWMADERPNAVQASQPKA